MQLGALVPYWAVVAFGLPSVLRTLDYIPTGCIRGGLLCAGFAVIVNPAVFLMVQWSIKQHRLPMVLSGVIAWLALSASWAAWSVFVVEVAPTCLYLSFGFLWVIVLYLYRESLGDLGFLGFHSAVHEGDTGHFPVTPSAALCHDHASDTESSPCGSTTSSEHSAGYQERAIRMMR